MDGPARHRSRGPRDYHDRRRPRLGPRDEPRSREKAENRARTGLLSIRSAALCLSEWTVCLFSILWQHDKIKSAMPAKKFEILFVEGADESAYLECAHGDQRVVEQSGKLGAIARLTFVDRKSVV